MEKKNLNCVAFDCGNSSIRVVLGRYDGNTIKTEVVHQVENYEIECDGIFYWDILNIYRQLEVGLQKAYEVCGRIDSVGISTWGIDYALLNKNDQLLFNPLCYRNSFGDESLKELTSHDVLSLFEQSGIQCDKINSIFQLLGYRKHYPDTFSLASQLLLIPDLLIYLFTGNKSTEPTITSTTQFYDTVKRKYSDNILNKFGIKKELLMPIISHGTIRGNIKDELSSKLGINKFPFICVPSHDTAAAVVSIPSDKDDLLFISSGTWSLIGTELAKPILNKESYTNEFTNESGAFDTITFLKNSAGMYLVQRLKKDCGSQVNLLSWEKIASIASKSRCKTVIDPNARDFFNPQNMAQAIRNYALQSGQEVPSDDASLFCTAYRSLASNYYKTIKQIENITRKKYSVIHMIGGGSRNAFLNQLTADITGKVVISGPHEATSLGNIASQLTYFDHKLDLKKLRKIIANSCEIVEFKPFVY